MSARREVSELAYKIAGLEAVELARLREILAERYQLVGYTGDPSDEIDAERLHAISVEASGLVGSAPPDLGTVALAFEYATGLRP